MSTVKVCPQCSAEYELDIKFCPKDGTTLRMPSGPGGAGGGEELVGSVIADRYHVLRKLGEGGMGHVYLAEHVKMGRKSAIKVMNPSISHNADAIGRFNREAANASRISHTNVAAIYDFGETPDGLIYLAMEYVEGESLTKVMERTGPLPIERAADIARQVADALDAAHELGIVHRDLKPDNIMIAKHRDGSDFVKVVDFGIAKAQHGEGQKVTRTGLLVGTPEYMSPEQLSGDTLDGRSDIYALGLVTFNMLTGVLPFPSSTLQESLIMRLTDRPRTLEEMQPAVHWPAPLQRVLDRALARTADERYRRASDFAADLLRAVHGTAADDPAAAGTRLIEPPAPRRSVSNRSMAGTPAATAAMPAPTRTSILAKFLGVGAGLLVIAAGAWILGSRQRAGVPGAHPVVIPQRGPMVATHQTGATATPRTTNPNASSDTTSVVRVAQAASSTTSAKTSPARPTPPRPRVRQQQHAAAPPAANPVERALAHPAPPAATGRFVQSLPPMPPSPPADSAAADDPRGELTAERARDAVGIAGSLLLKQPPEPDRALRILGRAIKHLPTLDDSITAFYHVSEALFQRADLTGNNTPKERACNILRRLRGATWHSYARNITAMYNQRCK